MSKELDQENDLPKAVKKEKQSNVDRRKQKQKVALLEQLKKTPIIQIACEKTGIGRATFYRWKTDDKEFSEAVEVALHEGAEFVNDMAESQLMSAIKDRNFNAIAFWLRNNHPKYSAKIEVLTKAGEDKCSLTPEQEASIAQALQLALHSGTGSQTQYDPNNANPTTESTSESNLQPGGNGADPNHAG